MALQNTTNKIACHPLPKGEYLGVGEQEESKANFAKRVREKAVPVWLRASTQPSVSGGCVDSPVPPALSEFTTLYV